jgi:sulfide:quinone oxidoreductase
VLVAGGGVAALETVFALRALAGDLVDIELLAAEPRFYYKPLAVTEAFGEGKARSLDLPALAGAAGAQLTPAELASVDPGAGLARTVQGMVVPYDALVVAYGASPRPLMPGAMTFRGPADADRILQLVADTLRGHVDSVVFAVPTLRTWVLPLYELAFGLRRCCGTRISIATVEREPLAVLGEAASALVQSLLVRDRIDVVPFAALRRSEREVVVAAPQLDARRVYGIPADEDGFVPTDRHARVEGLAGVYAAGDTVAFAVKHGSLAAAQADAAAESVAASAGADVQPQPAANVIRAVLYTGRETVYARRDLADPHDRGEVSRDPLWTPPSKISARYLAPALATLLGRRQPCPPISPAESGAGAPRIGSAPRSAGWPSR